jgi:hypothetical protein
MLLAPAFLIGAYIGYRRGWQREAFTSVGLAVAIIALRRGSDDVINVLNLVLARLTRVALLIISNDADAPAPRITVSPDLEPVVTLVLLVGLVLLAYLIGGRLGRRYDSDRAARWFGAIVGGLNFFVVVSRLFGNLRQVDPGPRAAGDFTIRVPAFPGLNIVVPSPPEGALLVSWPLAAIVFLLVSMLVYLLVRTARA